MKRTLSILLTALLVQGMMIANNEEIKNDGMGGRGNGSIYAPRN